MRLSNVGVSVLHFTLALAVILLFSSNTLAQHGAGGGGSSAGAGSSGGGGGGSHGGSSGGSASSGGGHSSGGSSSHSSTGHSSSAGSASSRSGTSHSNPASNNLHSIHAPSTGSRGQAQTSQKRGFFSFLRHPVRKPEPNPAQRKPEPKQPVAELRRPICFKGPCPVCPAGQVHGVSGCEGTVLRDRIRRVCPAGESWINGACLQQTWFQDECGGLRMMMERQAQRMQSAEQDRQITCSTGPRDQCTDLTSQAASEAGFYRELQNRYQACQRRSPMGTHFSGGFRIPGYSAGLSFDSLSMGLGRY